MEKKIAINIPIRCIGCVALRTVQYTEKKAYYKCRSGLIPGETCFRNTNFSD